MDESPAAAKRFFVEVDGTRYGPATVAILQEWVTAGRVTPDSMLIEEGTGTEIRAATLLGLVWNAATGMTPPPPEGAYAPRQSSSVWLFVIGGCGVFGCLGLIILAAILVPVFTQAKKAAQRSVEVSRVKQLEIALLMYGNDFDDKLPPKMDNLTDLRPYLLPYTKDESLFREPLPLGGHILGNKRLAGRSIVDVEDPKGAVMLYVDTPTSRGSIVGYVDGHVRATVSGGELQQQLSVNPFSKAP